MRSQWKGRTLCSSPSERGQLRGTCVQPSWSSFFQGAQLCRAILAWPHSGLSLPGTELRTGECPHCAPEAVPVRSTPEAVTLRRRVREAPERSWPSSQPGMQRADRSGQRGEAFSGCPPRTSCPAPGREPSRGFPALPKPCHLQAQILTKASGVQSPMPLVQAPRT